MEPRDIRNLPEKYFCLSYETFKRAAPTWFRPIREFFFRTWLPFAEYVQMLKALPRQNPKRLNYLEVVPDA